MFSLRTLPVLVLVILCFLNCSITAQVTCVPIYIKEYNGAGHLMPNAIKSLPDGTFLIAGKGTINTSSTYDGMVQRVTGTGTVIWSYLIGGAGRDEFNGITLVNDGTFLLYGQTNSFGYTGEKAWLVKIDNAGTLLWSRQLGDGIGNDRVKTIQQFSDGDMVGTFNINDSTALSNPVVFKMGLDGTLRWAQTFDQGNNDSFTSIAFSGNVIYASGYYTVNTHRAVIVKLSSSDGSVISSLNLYKNDNTVHHEVVGLEVYNNIISYGLWMWKPDRVNNHHLNGIILAKTDMADNNQYARVAGMGDDTMVLYPRRTQDNGFVLLRANQTRNLTPSLIKLSQYGTQEWGNGLSNSFNQQTNIALDLTADGGFVSAGSRRNFNTPYIMNMVRMNRQGVIGACWPANWGRYFDTVTYSQQPFTWAVNMGFLPPVNAMVAPVSYTIAPNITALCESSLCTDKTPLPPACNKTSHVQYVSHTSTTIRDAITTPDGGKLAIGDQSYDGLLMKVNANGDIAWSKQYETEMNNAKFVRIIRMPDDTYIIFANRRLNYAHTAWDFVSMIKVDINGSIIWVRDLKYRSNTDIADVFQTPDGGFVITLNDSWGYPPLYNDVIRYDANANMVWKKELKHSAISPVYKSVFCNENAVFIAHDAYLNTTMFGVEKLELATGNRIWTKLYNAAPSEAMSINRILVMDDTTYLFTTHQKPTGMFSSQVSTVLLKLNPDGNINQSLLLHGDNIVPGQVINLDYLDWFPPAVTLTPYNDFVLARRIAVGTDTLLSLSRIDKEGKVTWSGNYPATKGYFPMNVQPHGRGVFVMGYYPDASQSNYTKNNMFFIKADSNGLITSDGSSCDRVNRPLAPVPISFTQIPSRIDSVVDLKYYSITNGSMTSFDFPVDATLVCNTPANCNVVAAIPHGTGCSLNDTLTYLLEDKADCYAAVKWNYDPGFFKLITMNGDSIRVVPKKTGVYTIDARIEGSCMMTTQQIVSSVGISASDMTLGNDAPICDGQQLKLNAGAGYAAYRWSDNSTDSILTVTQPGKYYVDVTDNCGGTGTDTLLVTDAGLVFKITGSTTKCNSDTVALQASTGYNNYQWLPQVDIKATNNEAWVSPTTATKYYATAEKWPGCVLIDSILINTLTSPPVNLPGDVSICTGDSLLLQAAAGFDAYQWNTGELTSNLTVKTAGFYIMMAKYNNGCVSKDTFRLVGLYPLPKPALDTNSVLCIGTSRLLEPKQSFASYLWSDGSTGPSMSVSAIGKYWLAVTDNQACKGADTVNITSIAPPPANFLQGDTAICQYAKLTLVPNSNYKAYLWNDFSNSSSLTIKKPGRYWVTVTDKNNCSGSDSISVGGLQCMEGLFVPNAFTPNNDGENDVFRAMLFGNVTSFTFVVFNRWGGRVFETQDPLAGWNGKLNAGLAEKGTYVWYCRYTLEGLPSKVEKGIVELIR